jgi:hypothetical protein
MNELKRKSRIKSSLFIRQDVANVGRIYLSHVPFGKMKSVKRFDIRNALSVEIVEKKTALWKLLIKSYSKI